MNKEFQDFMTRKYAEAEEYASGVTREQEDIAREAWEEATELAGKEISRLRQALHEIAYSGRTKIGMKEQARAALFPVTPNEK